MSFLSCIWDSGSTRKGGVNLNSANIDLNDVELLQLVKDVKHRVVQVPKTLRTKVMQSIKNQFDNGQLLPFVIRVESICIDDPYIQKCIAEVNPLLSECDLKVVRWEVVPLYPMDKDAHREDDVIVVENQQQLIVEWTIGKKKPQQYNNIDSPNSTTERGTLVSDLINSQQRQQQLINNNSSAASKRKQLNQPTTTTIKQP